MEIFSNLEKVLIKRLVDLNCDDLTRAYIASILIKYKNTNFDYSRDSLTLLFEKASMERNFLLFQNIGDWIFFSQSIFPQHYISLQSYIENLGRLSYDRCYKIINKEFKIYQNLADDLPYLTKQTSRLIRNI